VAHREDNADRGGSAARGDGLSQCGWCGDLFNGNVGFLSRAIWTNFIQQRFHSCASVTVTKKNLKYSTQYSRMLVGPKQIRVNGRSLLNKIDR
jgi:hypothetical protein